MKRMRRLVDRGAGSAPAVVAADPMTVEGSLEPHVRSVIDQCLPYSLTGAERLAATVDAVEYVLRREIHGALVECGVWRGGSVLAMVLTLQHHGVDDRDVYLYDTFEGMTEPTDQDVSRYDAPALQTWRQAAETGRRAWEYLFQPETFGRAQVERLLAATGYPSERLHFVEGRVEDTIPHQVPDGIALLRLDTDWYESTRHELTHLYPRIPSGGVLIIDDYGHWEGCRRAVDEHFEAEPPLLLTRVDYTGRMAVKH